MLAPAEKSPPHVVAGPPTVIAADIRSYNDLLVALRVRAEAIDAPREEYDRVIGWADGLGSKLLSLPPIKHLGAKTLGPLLLVMGCRLQLVLDPSAVERYTSRLVRRQSAGNEMPAIKKRRKSRQYASRANSAWGRRLRALQLLQQPPKERTRIARLAAVSRWKEATRAAAKSIRPPSKRNRENRLRLD
jgi:hypothetical protein